MADETTHSSTAAATARRLWQKPELTEVSIESVTDSNIMAQPHTDSSYNLS